MQLCSWFLIVIRENYFNHCSTTELLNCQYYHYTYNTFKPVGLRSDDVCYAGGVVEH